MKKQIAIIGGGACALMLGAELDSKKYDISIYEKNTALGRKFLVAGDGGLNLTHSEDPEVFSKRYTPAEFLQMPLLHFSNHAFMRWLEKAGIPVFTGTSGRIFPVKKFKPIDVLNVFIDKIKTNHVQLNFKHTWNGFGNQGELLFSKGNENVSVKADLVIFCLGGASWPVTGSAGEWTGFFKKKGIGISPFYPSNCSYRVSWPEQLIKTIEGKALKNISIRCGEQSHPGEVVITRFGLEGSGIYPLSPSIRKSLVKDGQADIYLDLKPAFDLESLILKLEKKKGKGSYTEFVKNELRLSDTQLRLLKAYLSKDEFLDKKKLASHIKRFHLAIDGTGPLEDAISTVGGVNFEEVDAYFELKKLPGHFCIGEMLNYDAPTGGYLLQSCFTMAKYLADRLSYVK